MSLHGHFHGHRGICFPTSRVAPFSGHSGFAFAVPPCAGPALWATNGRMEQPAPAPAPARAAPGPAALWRGRALLGILVLACIAVEATLLGADAGLWGSPRWRPLAYQYGGFWAGLLRDWQPNYAAQPVAMFLTYSLLHAGPGHLAGNMIGLAVLGDLAVARLGARGFAALYALSAAGGALAFAMLNPSPAPMVGASGAIFGLAGAWTIWDRRARRGARQRDRSPWLMLGLLALNAAMWWLQNGQLAWEAHLGGYMAGMACAAYPRRTKTRL